MTVKLEHLLSDYETKRDALETRFGRGLSLRNLTPDAIVELNLFVTEDCSRYVTYPNSKYGGGPPFYGVHGAARETVEAAFVYLLARDDSFDAAMMWKLTYGGAQ